MELKKGERIDELHRNGYRIIQNTGKFCFGIDAVLLTGFAVVKEKETVLDLGTGTGIIPILLEAKTKGNHFTGLEIQEESVEMADRSVKLNCLEDKISIVKGDIKEAVKLFPLSSFDVITSNPPYMNNKNGIKNDLQPKSIARHEILCTLDDVIKNTASLLKVGGRFYMVHRPSRLPEIIVTLKKYKLEPKRIRLVHPYIDKEPNMVLIESVRHGKPLLKVEPPLIVYKSVGKYTDEIYDIYGYNQ
ncbi:tRNA1(Val) (adenine(37)-N6)-methyltransferase [Vallitalea sp.]|jgi:tRNA1(Val) A37 N6-methylase TrmN6|uniref:tRNA1(Val) (adenine(37)-N6)-methyltransferase n=1 Tax=Vallitalea sp. TaxID=1882829 RepID=UPI0025F713D1|nr:tRNA1(Val) (adenine(37)-N6)-methyltransferase [Vallitalea sp.]MCT4685711.1 tRNA1(Val) (adenine(37)-N6)-methyltransferase [Vallitalea sp.]